MSDYTNGKKFGFCPFSNSDVFIKNDGCGILALCDRCEDYFNGYQKGRIDMIDEFLKAMEKHEQDNWIDNLEYGITFADLEEVAEQLKEKEK